MIFGSTAYLSLRGTRLPKDLVKQIRDLVDNYNEEWKIIKEEERKDER